MQAAEVLRAVEAFKSAIEAGGGDTEIVRLVEDRIRNNLEREDIVRVCEELGLRGDVYAEAKKKIAELHARVERDKKALRRDGRILFGGLTLIPSLIIYGIASLFFGVGLWGLVLVGLVTLVGAFGPGFLISFLDRLLEDPGRKR